MLSENPANDVFVDLDAEGERNLLGNSGAAPGRISLLHFDNRDNEFFAWSSRPGLPSVFGRKQQSIFSLD